MSVRDGEVSADTNGVDVPPPGVPVLICGGGWNVMAESRAEVNGVGEIRVMAVTW